MMVVGPTGAGKSVLLALIAMQYRRYPGARIVIFDMGFSARAAVLAMGGSHHGLGPQPEHGDGGGLAFQPLRDIDDATHRSLAADWTGALRAVETVTLTQDIKDRIRSAHYKLTTTPPEERKHTRQTQPPHHHALPKALPRHPLAG